MKIELYSDDPWLAYMFFHLKTGACFFIGADTGVCYLDVVGELQGKLL